jgi:hypothetical protein
LWQEKSSKTIYYIGHDQVPEKGHKDVTYGRICADYQPQKEEFNQTRLKVGGNLIEYLGDVSMPTADTTMAKMVINSTILTPNAKSMCADIKEFLFGTPIAR